MKLSHGEVLDRLTILQIKRIIATDSDKLASICAQLRELEPEIGDSDRVLARLAILNTLIFLAVDEIVSEQDLCKCGVLGKHIQALNLQRSECKNLLDADSIHRDIKI